MKRTFVSLISLLLALLLIAAMTAPACADGDAPIAENLELKTYCNVTVGGALSGFSPDGDALRYEITTEPVKGELTLEEDGSFLYTPKADRRGKDYFGYKAIDEKGNRSQEATVIIRIVKQKKDVFYADMVGRADAYAAAALCEMGLLTGRQICGVYCFEPDEEVTRGEFLSMCMTLTGKPLFTGVYRTGFQDDHAIPAWQKAYASAAAVNGVYDGVLTETGRFFSGDEPISCAEASVLLDSALALENVQYLSGYEELDQTSAQACMNLSAHKVISGNTQMDHALTRSEAAKMLTAAQELLERR